MSYGLACVLEVSEFDLQLRYCFYFLANIPRKGMNPIIARAIGKIVTLQFIYQGGFGIKKTYEGLYTIKKETLNGTTTVFVQGWLWH